MRNVSTASTVPVEVWLSGLLTVALFAGLTWYLAPLHPGALALQLAWSPRAFGEIIHVWSEADLARYRNHLPVDFVLLAAYGTFGYLVGARTTLFRGAGARYRRVATWVLPMAALSDALENALHWWLTETPRFGVPLVYALSAGCAWLKWLLAIGFLLLVASVLVREEG